LRKTDNEMENEMEGELKWATTTSQQHTLSCVVLGGAKFHVCIMRAPLKEPQVTCRRKSIRLSAGVHWLGLVWLSTGSTGSSCCGAMLNCGHYATTWTPLSLG